MKTHKFVNSSEITAEKLKLRPIVSTVGTYYYQTAKHLASYLLPLTDNQFNLRNTLDFSDCLSDVTLAEDEILVSYDVSSLFTQVPLEETIDYNIHKIYNENKLPKLASEMLFKRLLLKVTQGTVFSFNNRLYKQIDGCGMGNPLSPVLANIFMAKLEEEIVEPSASHLYHRYVDDCFSKRKKDQPDELLEKLNTYHPNINFTVEENPSHFLDTKFRYKNGKFERSVYTKPGKIPTHWSSQIPKKWKRNAITGALHRAKRISTNLIQDIERIRTKFIKSGYPRNFVNNTIQSFQDRILQEEPLIPTFLFGTDPQLADLLLRICSKSVPFLIWFCELPSHLFLHRSS